MDVLDLLSRGGRVQCRRLRRAWRKCRDSREDTLLELSSSRQIPRFSCCSFHGSDHGFTLAEGGGGHKASRGIRQCPEPIEDDGPERRAAAERRGVLRRAKKRPGANFLKSLPPAPKIEADLLGALLAERDEGR